MTVSEAHWWLMGRMNALPMFSVHPKPTMSFGDPLYPSFSSLEFACFGLMNGGRRHETQLRDKKIFIIHGTADSMSWKLPLVSNAPGSHRYDTEGPRWGLCL